MHHAIQQRYNVNVFSGQIHIVSHGNLENVCYILLKWHLHVWKGWWLEFEYMCSQCYLCSWKCILLNSLCALISVIDLRTEHINHIKKKLLLNSLFQLENCMLLVVYMQTTTKFIDIAKFFVVLLCKWKLKMYLKSIPLY